jgi:NAD-dependent dihydropyrimidine dehydrogenase PreA subunit
MEDKPMVDCDYFEVIDFDEETGQVIHAVCSRSSSCWANCGSCVDRKPYLAFTPSYNHVLMESKEATLTQGDVNVLDGSINRQVRINNDEDVGVKRLYNIYKSL